VPADFRSARRLTPDLFFMLMAVWFPSGSSLVDPPGAFPV
jgi:hypothetical protein